VIGCDGFEFGGGLCLRSPEHPDINCYAVACGRCWLSVNDVPDSVRLNSGDCFPPPPGRSFRLASDLTLPPADVLTIHDSKDGSIGPFKGGSHGTSPNLVSG
jgi:Cupin